jgi:pyrroloquinoline quinone biosynthesis protein B
MRVRVLGAAAGGGFPQWNANNAQCRRARAGDANARPQTQASLAVEGGDGRWLLLNASPDLRQQIEATPDLHPGSGADGAPLRHSPIAGVVLTGAEVDQIAGLLILRERQPLSLYATARVLETLRANRIFDVLADGVVARRTLALNQPAALIPPDSAPPVLEVEAFAVPGKAALYLEDTGRADFGTDEQDTIGLIVRQTGTAAAFAFIPGCAAVTTDLKARLTGMPLLFFDGTLYRDDEMIRSGEGVKTGQRMGHISMSGEDGVIAKLADIEIGRKVFIHINNTNPVLIVDSDERRAVEAAGWHVAHDGMEVRL